MLNIKVLKALNGDSIIISYGDDRLHYIPVDGGRGKLCFHQLCKFIDEIKEKKGKIDLLVLTHIDSDHIDGILRLFSNQDFDFSIIEQMWFNFGERLFNSLQIDGLYKKINLYERDTKISWRQGEDLEEILQRTGIIRKLPIVSPGCHFVGGAKLTVLSPNVEILKEFADKDDEECARTTHIAYCCDYEKSVTELHEKEFEGIVSLTNRSSIAFLFEFSGKKLLLLGDAEDNTIKNSLTKLGYSNENKLKVDFCKIAHHASKHNTSNELIQMLDCSNYIISTQLTKEGRPSKECLSRIICNTTLPVKFYCNYDIDASKIFTEKEISEYGMEFIILNEAGINVEET